MAYVNLIIVVPMAASYMHILTSDHYISFTDVVHVMLLGSIDNGCTLMLSTNMIALCFEICILSGGGGGSGSGDDLYNSEQSEVNSHLSPV